MNKLQKTLAVTAIIQCVGTMLHPVAARAWHAGRYRQQNLTCLSPLECDQMRFARDEALLRKSFRRHADRARIGNLQNLVRRDWGDIVDDRGRPDNGISDDLPNVASHAVKRNWT